MKRVTVAASKTYDVLIGKNLLHEAGKIITKACGSEKILLVTDDIVNKLFADKVENSLKASGYKTGRFVFPHGEDFKNMQTFTAILQTMQEENLTRSDIVVALGGGVTGDMAGFASAVYLRGTKFVQIPTTLLAMVDSSVGGKTGIDMPAGKNQIGAFHQPDIVLCDTDVLNTLPCEVFSDGCAEIIKHGIIRSAELFEMLGDFLTADDPQYEEIIERNIIIKRDIVIQDERDTGVRQLLNFGHTIGHGIEKLSGYKVSHGSAVAAGMAIETRCAMRAGFCDADTYREITDMLEQYGLPIETDFTAQELIDAAMYDKKRSTTGITMIIPERIGRCTIQNFDMQRFAELVKKGLDC